MNKVLHVLVYVFLGLAGAALWFELQLNAKRAELTDRNRMQEDYLVKIAKTIEKSDPDKNAMFEIKKSPGIKEYSAKVENEFTSMFKKLNDHFIENGYAVYIGEYGATNKNNLNDRVAWFSDFVKEAYAYGMPCFLWDNGVWKVENDDYNEHYGFYNREAQSWYFPDILEAINTSSSPQ